MFDAFTSDPHYGHANVIKYSDRPYNSVDEMNESLISNYNSYIGVRDNCLWLGDCFLCPFKQAEQIMSRLNGRKFLVLGNHDRRAARMASLGFELVMSSATLNIDGNIVRASHFPYIGTLSLELKEDKIEQSKMPRWKRSRGEFLLHGHTHSKSICKPGDLRQIHVGVDAWDYRPARFEKIRDIIVGV